MVSGWLFQAHACINSLREEIRAINRVMSYDAGRSGFDGSLMPSAGLSYDKGRAIALSSAANPAALAPPSYAISRAQVLIDSWQYCIQNNFVALQFFSFSLVIFSLTAPPTLFPSASICNLLTTLTSHVCVLVGLTEPEPAHRQAPLHRVLRIR